MVEIDIPRHYLEYEIEICLIFSTTMYIKGNLVIFHESGDIDNCRSEGFRFVQLPVSNEKDDFYQTYMNILHPLDCRV